MPFGPPRDEGSAIGDRYVPISRSEAECEQLGREFSKQAKRDHPVVVGSLRRAFGLVLSDLGVDPSLGVVEALWIPYEMENQIRPWSVHNRTPEVPGDWWRGLVYVNGKRHLRLELDASLPEDPLMFFIAKGMQETVEEELGGPRPACPLHGHALKPSGTPGVAIWACPVGDQLWWCRMGSYREAVNSR